MPDAAPPRNPGPTPLVPTETLTTTSSVVACDGGNGVLGHPRVYLRIPDDAVQTFCPYCSRVYVLEAGADHDGAH